MVRKLFWQNQGTFFSFLKKGRRDLPHSPSPSASCKLEVILLIKKDTLVLGEGLLHVLDDTAITREIKDSFNITKSRKEIA